MSLLWLKAWLIGLWPVVGAQSKSLGWTVLACSVATIIEYFVAENPKTYRGQMINYLTLCLNMMMLTLIMPAFNFIATRLVPSHGLLGLVIPNWHHSGVAGAGGATLLYGLVWDFFQYWGHRLEHTLPLFWTFHRVHHSDPLISASTSFRQSLGGLVLAFFLTGLPTLIVLGFDPIPMISSVIFFNAWGYFNHANIRLSLGPLTKIISGPAWHRLHHGIDKRYYNLNYAAFFPILDVIFGTYLEPVPGAYPATGLLEEFEEHPPWRQALYPLWRKQ